AVVACDDGPVGGLRPALVQGGDLGAGSGTVGRFDRHAPQGLEDQRAVAGDFIVQAPGEFARGGGVLGVLQVLGQRAESSVRGFGTAVPAGQGLQGAGQGFDDFGVVGRAGQQGGDRNHENRQQEQGQRSDQQERAPCPAPL